MTLVRWQPLRSLATMGPREWLDDVFSSVFDSSVHEEGTWRPRVDIVDAKDSYEVYAELPGMKKDDFKVTYENNILTLSGERRLDERKEDECYHCTERQYGRFSRSFRFPIEIQHDTITADYKDGILHLKLPKVEAKKPHEIKVMVN